MAHRIYLYNVDHNKQNAYSGYLGEWKYEIPQLLLPLFFIQPTRKGHLLYFDRVRGVAYLQRFYDLLSETYQLNSQADFAEARQTMFDVLQSLPYEQFEMNATDVFNMNEESHRLQAQDLVEEILEKKFLYDQAIELRDLSVLNPILARSGYESFLEILQTDWIQWGLGYWEAWLYRDATESFEENGLWGLKNRKGVTVLTPQFSQISAFNEDGIAIFACNGRYGYLNHYGKIILDAQFANADDSFQLEGKNYAVVHPLETSEQQGVMCLDNGEWMIPACYDGIEQLLYSDIFNVLQHGKYWLFNLQHQLVIAESSGSPFEQHYLNEQNTLYSYELAGTTKRRYFLSNGTDLGEFLEDVLQPLSHGYLWIKPNKFQRKISILKPDGGLLLDDVDQLKDWSAYGYMSFAYRKQNKWFLYQTQTHEFLLQQGVDKLIDGNYLNDLNDIYPLGEAGQYGVYDAALQKWLIPLSDQFERIEHISHGFFRCMTATGHYYYDAKQKYLSESFDYIAPAILHYDPAFGQLTLFKDLKLFFINQQRQLEQAQPNQIGQFYLQRFHFQGKDLRFFEQFYLRWKAALGDQYFNHLEISTLSKIAQYFEEHQGMEQAVQYYQAAIDRGDSGSMVALGLIYDNGDGVEQDYVRALNYYQQAAQLGNAWGWNNLGCMYLKGQGVEANIQQATECFKQSAQLGNGQACKNLAGLYYDGVEVDQDLEQAQDYYQRAEQQLYFCGEQLADIYYRKAAYDQVAKLIKRDKTDDYTAIYYALMYEAGNQFKQNIKKAILYFEKALDYADYHYALKQLLFYYGKSEQFKNSEKYKHWKNYIESNAIQLDESTFD
ncbi:SEL1-like repeat protein [Acinetobacter gyllenbergii]|uniref:SEL1-like repeat protein n=1 Tax=Acinetobacter gyllenbergii TaxID=134534 RepID=UPI003F57DF41